jgi:NAD(P)-dependent dehydrogenase (short-subunit alcohol dehydrogenase family)
VAYSASKAVLTRRARVAAPEREAYGIRVNTIPPNAVSDTAIRTDAVPAARVTHYGLSLMEYETGFAIKIEVTSSAVPELAAEMYSPLLTRNTRGFP